MRRGGAAGPGSASLFPGDAGLGPEGVVAPDGGGELGVEAVELAARLGVVVELVAVDLADPHLGLGVARSLVAADGVALLAGGDEAPEVGDRLAEAAAFVVDGGGAEEGVVG